MFAPSGPLAVSRSYSFVNAIALQDLAGNSGGSFGVSFTTASSPDSTPPQVLFTNPADGASQVPINPQIQVLFDEPVQPTSLSAVTLSANTSTLAVTRTLSNGNRTLTLTPNLLLAPNTSHSLTISGVRDTAGNLISGTVTAGFTTGPGADIVGTTIVSTLPVSGTTGVPVSVNPQIVFSEPINPISVLPSSVGLRPAAGGAVVPATFSFSADLRKLTIIPAAALSAQTVYNLFSFNVTDVAGNFATNLSINFTTQ